MGANLAKPAEQTDLHSGVDLGPQEKHPGAGDVPCALENATKPGQRLGPQQVDGGVCFLVASDEAAKFAVEMGLLGEGCSIRSLQRPLDYVRVQHEHFTISQYDGTQRFRNESTFELRRGELDGDGSWVCLMLLKRPGLYAHMEKDGQLSLKPYSFLGREAFHFKLMLDSSGSKSPALLWDVSPPTLGLNSSVSTAPAAPKTAAPSLKPQQFMPTFSLPDYDLQHFVALLGPEAAPASNAAVCDGFERVD